MNSKVMNKVLSFLLVAAVAFTTIFTPVNAATVNSRDKKYKGKIKSMTVMNGTLEIQNKDIVPLPVGGTLNLTVDFVDKSEKKAASHEVVVKSSNKKALTAVSGYDKDLNESAPVLTLTENAKAGDKINVTIKSKAKKVKTVKFTVEVIDQVPVTGVTLDNTAPNVGSTINAKLLPENATSDGLTYQWYFGTSADAVVNPIEGETNSFLKVTSQMVGYFFKVIVTDSTGKTFESNATTTEVTTNELALKSVEGGAMNAQNGTYNVVLAYFNQPVTGLTAGDIQIRRVSNDQLYSVDSVSLSSDGMTATITLANSNAAGAQVLGLGANIDYNMIVTKDGSSASKIFYIPATLSDQTVMAVDAKAKTITIGYGYLTAAGAYDTANDLILNVPDTLTVDYNDILGRTVALKYDKNMIITALNVDSDETVVYGAFQGSASNKNLTDQVTGTVYKVQSSDAGTIRVSSKILKNATGWAAMAQLLDTDMDADNEGFSYGKLVLNSNGTIKVLVGTTALWTGYYLVTEVNGETIISEKKTEQNLKGYTILKEGKTIATSDIAAGDVVFFNTGNKFAEVYTTSETGALSAVYDGKFTFGGKTYDTTYGTIQAAMLRSIVYYNKTDEGRKAVDNDYLNSLKASGKDVTVFFSRNGQPVFLTGEVTAVVTSTKPLVLVDYPKFYTQSLSNFFRVKGFDGTEVKTYDIDLSKLEFVVDEDGKTFKKGYTPYAKGTVNPGKSDTFKGFVSGAVATTAAGAGSITETGVTNEALGGRRDIIEVNATNDTFAAPNDAGGNNIIRGAYLTLTFNDKDEITGINFEDAANGIGDAVATTSAAGNVFKTGLTVVNGLQCNANTPLYFYDLTKGEVTATTLGAYTGQATAAANVYVYSYDNKNVTAFVTSTANAGADTAGQKVSEVVVKDFKKTTEATPKMAELTVICGEEEKVYTKFATAASTATPVIGDIFTLTINKDGETVDGIAAVGDQVTSAITVTGTDSQTFSLGAATEKQLASTVTPTIVKYDETAKTYVLATFADLKDVDTTAAVADQRLVTWSYLSGSTNYVDTIVIDSKADTDAGGGPVGAANAIVAANNAFTALDGTVAKWNAYNTADAAADTAITAWETVKGSAAADSDFGGTGTYTTFQANATVATTTLATAKTDFAATAIYSAASATTSVAAVTTLATLKARLVCADDGIVKTASKDAVSKVAVKTAAIVGATSVTVTGTFIDGTTQDCTITTATLTEALAADTVAYPTT